MAGGPLDGQLAGNLKPGDRILACYDGEDLWHCRYLLSRVDRDSWIVVTPDADLFAEEISHGNLEWSAWRVWPVGSPVPFGVDGNLIYGFNPEPSAADLQSLIQEGAQHAAQERVRLGIAAPAAAVVPAAGVPAGGGPGGGGIAPAPVPALAGPGSVGGAVAALPNLAGAGGGHAGLVHGLAAGGPGANQSEDDARTLAISRDVDGLRFKEFRSAVQEAKPAEFADWPIAGPRTVKYVISQMLEHGGSAIAHHQAWRVACKLQPTDGPAMEHEAWSKVLQTMMTYDQLDVSNLTSAELVVRALQRIEEKHKFKLVSAEDAGEGALFMGASSGARVGSIISPKLTEWIGSEMQKEAMVSKERRKAREERALSRKGDKDAGAPK